MAYFNSSKFLLFYLNHPAHYHLFKNTINWFIRRNYKVKVIIVKKDILETLVSNEDWDYINLFPEGRRFPNIPLILTAGINLIKSEYRLFKFVWKNKPNILIGTEGTIAHIGSILHIPSLLLNEDDTRATPENYIFYPFATKILMPSCCDVDKWTKKKIIYEGYHELAYLAPKYFEPKKEFVEMFNPGMERYSLLRLASLTASHDINTSGIDDDILDKIIKVLSRYGKVFITSERRLQEKFEQYRININPLHMPHAIYYADMYVGDSQTMAAEAAVLGTPSIRFNSFVGKLGYLEELEKKYGLTLGIDSKDKEKLFNTLESLLRIPNLKSNWQEKRKRMLIDKIDVSDLMVRIIIDIMNIQNK